MKSNNRRVALVTVFLIGTIGAGNLILGVLSLLTINSMNIPDRISTFSSAIDSIDPNQIETSELRNQISNLKTTIIDELNLFYDSSQQLNLVPAYLIFQGIIFIATSTTIYLITPKKEKSPET